MNVTLVTYPLSKPVIKANLDKGDTMMPDNQIDSGVSINITEIVRAEVREAIKNLLASTFSQNVIKSGDGDGVKAITDKIVSKVNTASSLPVKVVKPDGAVQFRRRKRTQAEMKEAITNALPAIAIKHPDWSERRQRRLAKNLVRRYKI